MFLRIRNVFREAEPFSRPQAAVYGDRADEKIPGPASQHAVTKFDTKIVYRDLDDQLSPLLGVLNCPQARLEYSFAAQLHRDSGYLPRFQSRPAETDYRRGNCPIRLKNKFPCTVIGFPSANEKIRKLPVTVDDYFDTTVVPGRILTAVEQENG